MNTMNTMNTHSLTHSRHSLARERGRSGVTIFFCRAHCPFKPPCLLTRIRITAEALIKTQTQKITMSDTKSTTKQLVGSKRLREHDPELFDLIEREKTRQFTGLELIASEVRSANLLFTSWSYARTNSHVNATTTTFRTHRTLRPLQSWNVSALV